MTLSFLSTVSHLSESCLQASPAVYKSVPRKQFHFHRSASHSLFSVFHVPSRHYSQLTPSLISNAVTFIATWLEFCSSFTALCILIIVIIIQLYYCCFIPFKIKIPMKMFHLCLKGLDLADSLCVFLTTQKNEAKVHWSYDIRYDHCGDCDFFHFYTVLCLEKRLCQFKTETNVLVTLKKL